RHTRSKRDWSSDVCSTDLRWMKMMPEPKRLHPTVILFNLMKVMKEFLFFLIPGFVVFSGKALLYYLFILLGCIIVFIGFITISRSEERRVGKECRSEWSRS